MWAHGLFSSVFTIVSAVPNRYQDAGSFASGRVSLTTSHRRKRQALRSAPASALRKITTSSGWLAITKSLSSRRIATLRLGCRREQLVTSVPTDICGARQLNEKRQRSHWGEAAGAPEADCAGASTADYTPAGCIASITPKMLAVPNAGHRSNGGLTLACTLGAWASAGMGETCFDRHSFGSRRLPCLQWP
jgi:hypothetical protein